MSLVTISLIGMGLLLVLLLSGLEVAVVLGWLGCLAVMILLVDVPFLQVMKIVWASCDSFILTAIPLFIFMGSIFTYSGTTRLLFRGVNKWLGGLPGGLACSIIGSCGIFAAISGSSVATAATMGTICLPEMERYKYNTKLSLGTIAAGGTLGILIPPSINMIVYGEWTGESIVRLFAAGIVPGIILLTIFIGAIILLVKLRPSLAPKPEKFTWKERLYSIKDVGPWLALIVVILGGIFAGIMTPTEAAALGCVASMVIALAYRELNVKMLQRSLADTIKLTSMILFIIAGAKVLAFAVHYLGIGKAVSTAVLDFGGGEKYAILVALYVMYLIMGMFLDAFSMMVLTLPFVMPIIYGLGLSGIWFGIVLTVLIEAGLITPPVGINLYVLKGLNPKYDIMTIALGSAPFLLGMLVLVAMITYWPQITLWLPSVIV